MASDTVIFITIVSILLLTNFAVAMIGEEFNNSRSEFDSDALLDDAQATFDDVTEANAFSSIKAISGVFLWSFGLLPAWLDVIFILLRVTGYIIVYKWIRGVAS